MTEIKLRSRIYIIISCYYAASFQVLAVIQHLSTRHPIVSGEAMFDPDEPWSPAVNDKRAAAPDIIDVENASLCCQFRHMPAAANHRDTRSQDARGTICRSIRSSARSVSRKIWCLTSSRLTIR